MNKPKILVVQDYFLPAYKGGGSLRTVVNIIDRLAGDFAFDVLARDRDQGDTQPFPDLEDGWMQRKRCRVRYLPPSRITPAGLRHAAAEYDYGLIYFNSFFSKFTVWLLTLRRLGLLRDRPVLLAPRGELATNALAPFVLEEFRGIHKFQFPLLSDHDALVSDLYGAKYHHDFTPMKLDRISKRAAFLVDKAGAVQYAEVLDNAGELPDFEAIKQVIASL